METVITFIKDYYKGIICICFLLATVTTIFYLEMDTKPELLCKIKYFAIMISLFIFMGIINYLSII